MAFLSDEDMQNAVEAYRACGNNASRAALAMGISRPGFEYRLQRAALKGLLGTGPVLPGFAISRTTTVKNEEGETVREFIQQKPDAGEDFSVPNGHRVKGVSAYVGADGRTVAQWIKTSADQMSVESIIENVKQALSEFKPKAKPVKPPRKVEGDLATVYVAADWHVGLLAWGEETGENYDLKIAKQTIEAAMSRLVAGTPNSKQAVVLVLGDLLHADGYVNVTPTSKNPLDVDGRYPHCLRAATHLLIFTISLALEKHQSVLVRILRGNHDDQSAIAVALALAMYYRESDRVTVDDDPGLFWWWSWGRVLLGATHGDKVKMKDLPLLMASRNGKAWGQSKFRHIFTGHIHTQTGIEMNGVTVESFQTPVAPDAWHIGRGYGANRSSSAVTFHRAEGEISRHKVNIL